MQFVYFIIIGIIAGWLGSQIMKGSSSGLVMNLILGVIGSVLGGFVLGLLDLAATGGIGELVTATIGACLLIFLFGKFGGGK